MNLGTSNNAGQCIASGTSAIFRGEESCAPPSMETVGQIIQDSNKGLEELCAVLNTIMLGVRGSIPEVEGKSGPLDGHLRSQSMELRRLTQRAHGLALRIAEAL